MCMDTIPVMCRMGTECSEVLYQGLNHLMYPMPSRIAISLDLTALLDMSRESDIAGSWARVVSRAIN